MSEFAGLITMSSSPQSVFSILNAAGMGNPGALSFLQLAEAGAGTLALSTDSAIAAEADGYPVGDNTNPVIITVSGAHSDVIKSGALYLFSATASKTVYIIARSKF